MKDSKLTGLLYAQTLIITAPEPTEPYQMNQFKPPRPPHPTLLLYLGLIPDEFWPDTFHELERGVHDYIIDKFEMPWVKEGIKAIVLYEQAP